MAVRSRICVWTFWKIDAVYEFLLKSSMLNIEYIGQAVLKL